MADEWQDNHPDLLDFASILKGRSSTFQVQEITENEDDETVLRTEADETIKRGYLSTNARMLFEGNVTSDEFRRKLLKVLYEVGMIGLKSKSNQKVQWCYSQRTTVPDAEFENEAKICIHKMFWSELGIRPSKES